MSSCRVPLKGKRPVYSVLTAELVPLPTSAPTEDIILMIDPHRDRLCDAASPEGVGRSTVRRAPTALREQPGG